MALKWYKAVVAQDKPKVYVTSVVKFEGAKVIRCRFEPTHFFKLMSFAEFGSSQQN